MFLDKGRFLGCDLLFQLVDLVVHDLQLPLHLGDLILGRERERERQNEMKYECMISSRCYGFEKTPLSGHCRSSTFIDSLFFSRQHLRKAYIIAQDRKNSCGANVLRDTVTP